MSSGYLGIPAQETWGSPLLAGVLRKQTLVGFFWGQHLRGVCRQGCITMLCSPPTNTPYYDPVRAPWQRRSQSLCGLNGDLTEREEPHSGTFAGITKEAQPSPSRTAHVLGIPFTGAWRHPVPGRVEAQGRETSGVIGNTRLQEALRNSSLIQDPASIWPISEAGRYKQMCTFTGSP